MKQFRLPNFIIGGAPRSGTSWLYTLLDNHPKICMAKPRQPEPKFFLVDELYSSGIDYYAKTWFSQNQSCMFGEKSTNYLESKIAAYRIYKHIPTIKLIFILRNPIYRAFSNYLWSCMNGLEKENFIKALHLEEKREKNVSERFKYSRPHAYFSRGLYAELLQPYYKYFQKEQILCLKFEDIIERPNKISKTVCHFLQIDSNHKSADKIGIINPSKKNDMSMSDEAYYYLLDRYKEPNLNLANLLGPEFKVWNYE